MLLLSLHVVCPFDEQLCIPMSHQEKSQTALSTKLLGSHLSRRTDKDSGCAERVAGKVVVDAFCGVGGNAVHFARRCRHVIGIDNCLPRLELAQQNARVYGVAGRLDLLCSDYFDLRDQLKASAIFNTSIRTIRTIELGSRRIKAAQTCSSSEP